MSLIKFVYVKVIQNKNIDKTLYEELLNLPLEYEKFNFNDIENIINEIDYVFKLDFNKHIIKKIINSENVIFPKNSTGRLFSIDLNTFKASFLNYAPKIGENCYACLLDKENYFYYGGRINGQCKGEAYIINIKEKKYDSLPDGFCKAHGGSILKNNKIYIFGGLNDTNILKTCETFDLTTKE